MKSATMDLRMLIIFQAFFPETFAPAPTAGLKTVRLKDSQDLIRHHPIVEKRGHNQQFFLRHIIYIGGTDLIGAGVQQLMNLPHLG